MTIKYRDDIPERKREPRQICWCGECKDAIYEGDSYYDFDDVDGEKIHRDCLEDYFHKRLVKGWD